LSKLSESKVDQAIIELKRVIELNPNDAKAHYNLGIAYSMKGLVDQAMVEHKRAVELEPNHMDAHLRLGGLYALKRRFDQAILEYRLVLELNPDHARAHSGLGMAYARKGWIDQAITELRRAIELDPSDADTCIVLVKLYESRGLIDQAIAEYKRAIELKRDFAPFHHMLGDAYIRKGLVDEAIVEYKRAAELNFSIAHHALGLAYDRKGLVDQAVAEYKRVIEMLPDFSSPHYRLGLIYAQKGLIDEAITEYKLAIELEQAYTPKDVGLFRLTAVLGDEAITERKQLSLSIIHYSLGQVYERKGWTDKAVTEYKRAMELNPNDAKVHFQLRELHYKKFLGKPSDEIQHDITGTILHIDEKRDRDFSTIITSGMSSMVQTLPKTLSEKDAGRIELMWYVRNPEPWMFHFLIPLAKYPFIYKTFFWNLTTFENADGSLFPNPFLDSKLQHIIFLPPVFEEKGFREGPVLDKIPVHFLWVFPITYEEMKYKLEKGSDAFADLIAEKEPPRVFDPYRKSMV